MKKIALVIAASGLIIGALSVSMARSEQPDYIEPTYAEVLGTHVGSWSSLKDAVKKAKEGETIVLDNDIESSGDSGDRIVIDQKKNLTIDLQGFKVDRKRVEESKDGHAFEVKGYSNVTITNSRYAEGKSIITGGYAENGGGVNIHDGSTAKLEHLEFVRDVANTDGGAIFNRGHLIMEDCIIRDCIADDTGGGIYNNKLGWFELKNVTISNCVADNDGGAINAHLAKDSTITDCVITNNKSLSEDGGGISLDASKTLSIYTSEISYNSCENNGGGIDVEDGMVVLYGTKVSNNSAEKGGGIYFEDSFKILSHEEDTIIEGNYASIDGGGIYNDDGNMVIDKAIVRKNVAHKSGGGFRLRDGNSTIHDVEATDNETQLDHGGAMYIGNDAVLNLNGGTFTGNNACQYGGAIYFDEKTDEFNIKGKITIQNNIAVKGNDVLVDKQKKFNIVGPLTDSKIGVGLENKTGTFTSGFKNHHPEVDPSTIFMSNLGGTIVTTSSNEATIIDKPKDPKLLRSFLGVGQEVEIDRSKITGSNWLSGISGERYINEINIPGTHDTSMKSIGANSGPGATFNYGNQFAKTQKEYIPQQLEGGVRLMDIRLNNLYPKQFNFPFNFLPNYLWDDCSNLWQCHGKKFLGGTYWAEDASGDLINLKKVLGWVKSFLIKNPSEFVVLSFTYETPYDGCIDTIYSRLNKTIKKFIKDNPTNPSTGEPFVYLEDGIYGKTYTRIPKLKNVRGKILLDCDRDGCIGGFRTYSLEGVTAKSQDTSYKVKWDEKLASVNRFYAGHEKYDLPRNAGPWAHHDEFYKLGLNCAPQKSSGLPDGSPLEHCSKLLPKLFEEEGGAFYDIKGKYVGWINTDGCTAKEWGKIWRSNFFDELEFVTATVDPCLNLPEYQTKQFTVYKNTEITLPYFIFEYDEVANNHYFQGWDINGDTYHPGYSFILSENVTVKAKWADGPLYDETTIDVVFRDCDNYDHLRPDEVEFTVKDAGSFTVKSSEDWHYVYSGLLIDFKPNWSLITGDDHGQDVEGEYRYELTGDILNGYVVTFVHTSDRKCDYHGDNAIEGEIHWDDYDDHDGYRPNAVYVTFKEIDSSIPAISWDDLTISPAWASNNWKFRLWSNQLPYYEDGEKIQYELMLTKDFDLPDGSTINVFPYIDQYSITQESGGYDIYCKHEIANSDIAVNVRWADSLNKDNTRPESVVVHVFGDGVEIESQVASGESEDKSWAARFLMKKYTKWQDGDNEDRETDRKAIEYTISVTDMDGNPVAGYETLVTDLGGNTFDALLSLPDYELNKSNQVIEDINDIGTVEYTKTVSDKIDTARLEYDALGDADKSLVFNIGVLETAENSFSNDYAELIVMDERIENFNNSFETMKQKRREAEMKRLEHDVNLLEIEDQNRLINKAIYDQRLAEVTELSSVYDLIDVIGDFIYTDEYKARMDAARAAVNVLTPEQKARLDNYNDLVFAEAEYFATYFLTTTDSICSEGGESANHLSALQAVWTDLSNAWTALSDDTKAMLVEASASETMNGFSLRYTHIMNRYSSGLTAFENGPVYNPNGSNLLMFNSFFKYASPFVFVGLFSIISFAGVMLLISHKKKKNR